MVDGEREITVNIGEKPKNLVLRTLGIKTEKNVRSNLGALDF
mgnify:CR=1 FL=1